MLVPCCVSEREEASGNEKSCAIADEHGACDERNSTCDNDALPFDAESSLLVLRTEDENE